MGADMMLQAKNSYVIGHNQNRGGQKGLQGRGSKFSSRIGPWHVNQTPEDSPHHEHMNSPKKNQWALKNRENMNLERGASGIWGGVCGKYN